MSANEQVDDVVVRLGDLRDLAQAAGELGVSPERLRSAIDHGRIAARKVGESWITTAQEIDRYRRQDLTDELELTAMDAVGDDGQVFGG